MAAWLSKTDLCRRGWTLEAVARWLGPPERREMSRRTGVERHLYGRDRVELAETDPSFVAWQESHTLRREARRQAIERAAERRVSFARAWSPRILRLPLDQLEAMSIATYNRRLEDRAWRVFERGGEVEDLPSAADNSCPRPFLERIMVNHLRHVCTNYDARTRAARTKVRGDEVCAILRHRVLDAIAAAYPELAAEVERQREKRPIPVPEAVAHVEPELRIPQAKPLPPCQLHLFGAS